MQIIPMRDLKNTVEVERRCAEENGPVYVTKNGYGRLVVMDIEYYERTMRKMYEAQALIAGNGRCGSGPHKRRCFCASKYEGKVWPVNLATG